MKGKLEPELTGKVFKYLQENSEGSLGLDLGIITCIVADDSSFGQVEKQVHDVDVSLKYLVDSGYATHKFQVLRGPTILSVYLITEKGNKTDVGYVRNEIKNPKKSL